MAGDLRYWMDDRLQTLVFVADASINLDFFGVGDSAVLDGRSLSYNLAPIGGMAQAKYRVGDTRTWVGLGYSFADTEVDFEAPPTNPGLPSFSDETSVGGLTPSITFDTRDNMFTPLRGTYLEASAGFFSEALGGDDEFQRAQFLALEYFPLRDDLTLGLRGQVAASFGDEPFYLRPYVALRGAPAMRYQGEETALIESELRWQFWQRWSAVGFAGTGSAWNDFEQFDDKQSVVTGGTGFRYELARSYGIHVGLDVAVGPDGTAIYVQVGSAWARP
jgi:outer membrane protein assembly factor BamA